MRTAPLLALAALSACVPVHRHRGAVPHATAELVAATAVEATLEVVPSLEPAIGSSTVTSTAYCQTGTMADGRQTYQGAVAGDRWPLGTRLAVSDSPDGPEVVTVADRIGAGSDLDFALPGQCQRALDWGRHPVRVSVEP